MPNKTLLRSSKNETLPPKQPSIWTNLLDIVFEAKHFFASLISKPSNLLLQRRRNKLSKATRRNIFRANLGGNIELLEGRAMMATLVTFDFAGLAGSELTDNSDFAATGLATSTISRGAGLTAAGNADRFNATNWALTSIANAVSGNDYMEFTVTPNAGKQFSVSSIVANWQRSGSGNTAIALRSSVDSYATNLDNEKTVVDNASTQVFTWTFAQTNTTQAVIYRLYSYAEAVTGTGGPGDGTGNDIIVNGEVSDVAVAPTVTSSAATSVSTTGATLNGNVTADGGASLTERGFYTKTASGVTTSDTKRAASGTTTGAYTLGVTSLSVNTRYYYKSFATNSVNTSLSSAEQDFWTLANAPSAPTLSEATATGMSVAIGSGDGNPATTQYAIQTTNTNQYVQADGTLGASEVWQTAATWGTRSVSGLTSSTSYIWQVKARNGANTETAFGTTASLSTSTASSPTLTAATLSSAITATYPSASTGVSFTAAGTNLTGDITVTAQSGYEVSTVLGSGYGGSVAVASDTTVYVRFAASRAAGSYNSATAAVLSGGGASSSANITTSSSGNTISAATPPTLTAAVSASVDSAFVVTFPDNAMWQGQISSITVGGTTLAPAAYSVSSGQITFTPSQSALLQSSGSKAIVVNATNYNATTSLSQTINAGVATQLAVTTQPAAPASNGAALATQPVVTVQDQYSNTVTGSSVSVTAAVGAGTWTVGGTTSVNASSGVATFSGLTATSAAAVTGATISFTATGLTGATSGTFNIPAPAPANNLSSSPTSITVNGGDVSGTTFAATYSTITGDANSKADVWFTFTAPASGTVTLTTTSSTSQDLDIEAWAGPSAPTSTAGELISNGADTDNTTEVATFIATSGTVYFVRVLQWGGTAGNFTINAAMNVPYVMSSGNYSQDFADIANWGNNFASGTGAANFSAVAVNNTGTIPDGVRTTVSSATFSTSFSGGIQKGSGNLQFLSTGTTNSVAVDLPLDFTGRTAGTITFDWACVFNSTGNRGGTLRVYTSTDGTTWTLLGTSVSVVNNVASSGTFAIQLPSSFNNNANAKVRFYQYADAVGTTGSRPKISIDNLAVTAPTITIGGSTSATATAFTTTYGTASAAQTFAVSGSNLTANLVATAPTGFEVSSDGTTYGTTATFTQSGGSASGSLRVRLSATATVSGTYNSQSIALSSTGATTVNITTPVSGNGVTAAPLTITAEAKAKAFGASDPLLTYTTTDFVNGETALTALNGVLIRVGGEAPGTYAINQGSVVAVNGNYAINYQSALLTIAAAPAPTFTSASVNGADSFLNNAQRSQITSLVLNFSAPVVVAANAFTVANVGLFATQTAAALASSQILVTGSGTSQITLRWGSGTGVQTRLGSGALGNSLMDGNWQLTIDPSKITTGGTAMTGNTTFGTLASDNFFRMYGDSNGDGVSSGNDLSAYRTALTTFNAAFDFNGDGVVNSTGVDYTNFVTNYGKRRRTR